MVSQFSGLWLALRSMVSSQCLVLGVGSWFMVNLHVRDQLFGIYAACRCGVCFQACSLAVRSVATRYTRTPVCGTPRNAKLRAISFSEHQATGPFD